jgi:CheY-like chemotaxis protein
MPGNVLVVEDDDSVRRLLVDYFREHSELTVAGARDGADALHEVATRRIDVVVLDLMMPYMSGVDFLVSLATLAGDPTPGRLEYRPAVVVITGAAADDLPTETIEHRFRDFVRCVHRKPLDVPELAACVCATIRN